MSECKSGGSESGGLHVSVTPVLGCWHATASGERHVSDTTILECWHATASGGALTFIATSTDEASAMFVKSGGGGAKSVGVWVVVAELGVVSVGRKEGCVRGDRWNPPVNGNSLIP